MTLTKWAAVFLLSFLSIGASFHIQNSEQAETEQAVSERPDWSKGWYKGAGGYTLEVAEYEKTNKPMAVYIDVDWCPPHAARVGRIGAAAPDGRAPP